MKTFTFNAVLAACFAFMILQGCTQTNHDYMINPAYRPFSEGSSSFLKELKTAKIAVYPSIVRTLEGTSYSKKSQQQIVSFFNDRKVTHAIANKDNIKLGQLNTSPQWNIFVDDMHAIADTQKRNKLDANYSLVMAFVFPPDNQSIWGIHCYILDQQGNNAFSFLLNSHHKLFVDAKLNANDTSESSRAKLIEKATQVALLALIQQVNAPEQDKALQQQGYSMTSQSIAAFNKKVEKVFIIVRLEERLIPVFMHSFHHSLVSGFEANDVQAKVKFMAKDSNNFSQFEKELEEFSPDALMHLKLDSLVRARKDGKPAIVGTDFEVSLTNKSTEEMAWQAKGKVDYLQNSFSSRSSYTAHEGIRKEFAWHTTAAIVRTFTLDVNDHKSAPIYTVTEDRQLYQQRTD